METGDAEQKAQRRIGKWFILFGWLLFLGLLTMLFQSLLDNQYNPNSSPDVVSSVAGSREIVLQRNCSGHYVASGSINGHEVVFMLDTGATSVAVPAGLADRLGLDRGIPGISRTANGDVTVWSTRLDTVALGPIERRDVRASILPSMQGEEVLLGMSYLKHLEITQRGDQLRLREY